MAGNRQNRRGIVPRLQFNRSWIRYWRGELAQQPNVVNPYGTHTHGDEELAIEGVANWTDIWTDWGHVGDDFTLRSVDNKALHKNSDEEYAKECSTDCCDQKV